MGSLGLKKSKVSKLVGLCRNTLGYKPKPDKDEALRARMKELAEQRRRAGCQMLHFILKREGLVKNHKRTERIYREERLALRIRRRKKLASQGRVEITRANRRNELWAMDFMQDALHNGRRIRLLTVEDTYTKECLRIEVDTSIRGTRVADILSQIVCFRGLPENIIVDNGPEFVSNAMDEWAYERGVKLHFIRPGKPVDNAYIESFNGRLREECLNLHWFISLSHARTVIEEWRNDYNLQRPHTSLKGLTPYEFAGLAENSDVEYSNYGLHNNWG
jgi:putative transposase